jgi:hypothetical protein
MAAKDDAEGVLTGGTQNAYVTPSWVTFIAYQ